MIENSLVMRQLLSLLVVLWGGGVACGPEGESDSDKHAKREDIAALNESIASFSDRLDSAQTRSGSGLQRLHNTVDTLQATQNSFSARLSKIERAAAEQASHVTKRLQLLERSQREHTLSKDIHTEEDKYWHAPKTAQSVLAAKDIRWRFLSHHPQKNGSLMIWGSYSLRFENLTSKPLKVTYLPRFKDEYGLNVGSLGLSFLFKTPTTTELPPGGAKEEALRFSISVGSLQEASQAATMEIVNIKMD